ncbi:MAG TPA: GDP-mannose 4,6-dehydratase [Planctomycetota bacterium]|nr:GDP-mannose 4,6-dehydratase [Planctomycetota bacterium]
MRRVLITGGAGFIGSHLAEKLLDEGGFEVVVLDSFDEFYDPAVKRRNAQRACEKAAKGAPYMLIEGDIRDEKLVGQLFSENRFDQVVHIAARAGVRPSIEAPLLYESVNVHGTLVLLEAMRRTGVKDMVFASSSSVYGEAEKVPFSETDPVDRPISPYAATKRACEIALATWHRLYKIEAAILRFFTVYGPRQRPDLAIAKFTRLIDEGKPIPVFGDGSARRDFTYVEDILQGIRSAMDRCRGYDIFNLGESATTTVAELIRMIEDSLGKKAQIDRRPAQPGDVPVTYADISKAKAHLDYRPQTPIAEGVRRYVEWYRAEKKLNQH